MNFPLWAPVMSPYAPHAYLFTPIPELVTLALFRIALLGLGTWAHGVKRKFC